MSQDYNALQSGVTLFSALYGVLNNNFAALRTLFSGSAAPSSPAVYQRWLDTSGGTPRLKIWDGAAWRDITDYLYPYQSTKTELEAARGSAASLDARLDVALNEDGTLKAGAPAGGWWATEADTVAYASASSFTVDGDKSAVYTARRAVSLTQTSNTTGHVTSSSYASGPDETTVNVDCTVDTGLGAVQYGQPVNNDPAILDASETSAGVIELATTAEAQALTDALRAITPATLGDVLSNTVASESAAGLVELATAAETATGTDDTRAVHPAGLQARLSALLAGYMETSHAANAIAGFASTGSSTLVKRADSDAYREAILLHFTGSGVHGGGATAGSWQTRPINTEHLDEIGITLASNQFTIVPAGTFYIEWWGVGYKVDQFQTALYSVTGSTYMQYGEVAVAASSGASVGCVSHGMTRAVQSPSTVYEIRNRVATTNATHGMGIYTGWATNVYLIVRIRQKVDA